LLIDATLKHDMPPLALPTEKYMTAARKIWEELQLPHLTPRPPWHGYHLGDWDRRWDEYADAAVTGSWRATGDRTFANRKGGLKPETPLRDAPGSHD
jgi:4-hydroxy-3-polyprenylbenzoate decarboxylase